MFKRRLAVVTALIFLFAAELSVGLRFMRPGAVVRQAILSLPFLVVGSLAAILYFGLVTLRGAFRSRRLFPGRLRCLSAGWF